ncbi:MAG TPA: tetratricopeptide repeat protein [Candidatus Acidoferrum sp.]|nr:tetratricopeptide repeat protein [Candidatus Acidoferrum sp.]
MTEQNKTRRQKLEQFLAENPNDAFTRYGIALDCFRQGDLAAADMHFKTLLQINPDYVPAYQMYAQMLAQSERVEDAKTVLARGVECAAKQGNAHARSEMEGQLSELS